jgi:hypothetical protein
MLYVDEITKIDQHREKPKIVLFRELPLVGALERVALRIGA